jgi:hypothetical protein
MTDAVQTLTPTVEDREAAREYVMHRLGLVSMAVWVVGVLLFMTVVFPGSGLRPTSGMIVGAAMFFVAALPWLAFHLLVERRAHQLARARGTYSA